MPKKKQVTFQSNIPGKFIPRDDLPSASVFRPGTNANRFNSKMAELLASSSTSTTINNENELIQNSIKSSQDNPMLSTSPETTTIDSSRVHSRLLHRRIVTMLETLRGGRDSVNGGATSSPRLLPSNIESKSQPITFGQLRQATTSTVPPSLTVAEDVLSSRVSSTHAYTDFATVNTPDKQPYYTSGTSLKTDTRSDLTLPSSTLINKSSSKHRTNKTQLQYSPSLDELLKQGNVVPQMKEHEEDEEEQQQSKPPLTVDEILATYYSKVKVPTTTDIQSSQSPSYPNSNVGFHVHSAPLEWNSSQTNQRVIPAPPRLLLNEQNRNRPPPPSYSFSVASGHRPPPTATNRTQHLIRPPISSTIHEHAHSGSQITQHLLPGNPSLTRSTSPPSVMTNTPIRPPPPRYASPTTNIERSHSALSSMNRPNYSQVNPPQAGFDREFSRLLYGKDGGKTRHQRQKRKSYSDPVKKSVEEAGRSVEKTHRRLTTHLNKTDTVREEEENGSDSNEIDKQEQNSFPRRHFQRQSDLTENNRESAKKRIVPANPVLKRRIPSFLRVYSQASSSNDILLQWQLFSLSELQSFDAMMTKLYKDENLARVKFYEMYRVLLTSILASKTSANRVNIRNYNDNDDDAITTTAL